MTISLRRFLSFGLAAVSFSGVLMAAALWNSSRYTKHAIDKLTESIQSADSAQLIQTNLTVHRQQALLKGLEVESERKRQTDDAKRKLLEASEHLSFFATSPAEAQIIANVRQSVLSYLENYDSLSANGVRGEKLYVSVTEAFHQTQKAVHDLTRFNLDEAEAVHAETVRQSRHNHSLIIGAAILLSLTLIVLIGGLRKFLYRPIVELNEAIQSFEADRTTPAAIPEGAFEIQTIWKSFAKLSERLARQKDAQLVFLSSIAHDLKNPLGAIKMSTELISDDASLTAQSRQMLQIVSRQTVHLSRLINDLLDTTRIESGHIDLQFKSNDIRRIVQESALLHSNLSSAHKFDVAMPDEPVRIQCDEQRLTQVFNNLFNNALKYSPDGGLISANLYRNGDYVVIDISDSGVGIPPEDIEGIFEPFHRSRNTRTTIPGIGLGLSVSRKIVRGHKGGEIFVSSVPGQGTTFSVRLRMEPTA